MEGIMAVRAEWMAFAKPIAGQRFTFIYVDRFLWFFGHRGLNPRPDLQLAENT